MLRLSLGSLLALALMGLASGGPAPPVVGTRPLSDADLALIVGSDCPKAGFKAKDPQRCGHDAKKCEPQYADETGGSYTFLDIKINVGAGKLVKCGGSKENACNSHDSYDDADNTARNKQIPNTSCGKYNSCICGMSISVFGKNYFEGDKGSLGVEVIKWINSNLNMFRCSPHTDDDGCNRNQNCSTPNSFTNVDPTCGM